MAQRIRTIIALEEQQRMLEKKGAAVPSDTRRDEIALEELKQIMCTEEVSSTGRCQLMACLASLQLSLLSGNASRKARSPSAICAPPLTAQRAIFLPLRGYVIPKVCVCIGVVGSQKGAFTEGHQWAWVRAPSSIGPVGEKHLRVYAPGKTWPNIPPL